MGPVMRHLWFELEKFIVSAKCYRKTEYPRELQCDDDVMVLLCAKCDVVMRTAQRYTGMKRGSSAFSYSTSSLAGRAPPSALLHKSQLLLQRIHTLPVFTHHCRGCSCSWEWTGKGHSWQDKHTTTLHLTQRKMKKIKREALEAGEKI